MLHMVTGAWSDEQGSLSMTPAEARALAEDLVRCADEAVDHESTFELHVKSLTKSLPTSDMVFRVSPFLG